MPDQRSPHVIIGATGALGFGLAVRLAHAGLPIVIGSRAAERAEQAAGALRDAVPGADARGLHNDEAAAAGDIVFLSVPFSSQAETLAGCGAHLRAGALLVDATVPLAAPVGGKATRTIGVWQGSVAQQAQELVPEASA
jgi:NADPH-dependent F420 reductase